MTAKSKKSKTTTSSKAKKTGDANLKKALATTSANLARIEAAERGKKPVRVSKDAARAEGAAKTKAANAARGTGKKMSGLDAAARLLVESKQPLNAQEIIKALATKGYWKSPGGKTPHATMHAAMSREIRTKGKDSRFRKAERGMFAATKK